MSDEQKFYTIYQTTNLVNGKIYIGQHGTTDLNDGYLGSGSLIKKAIKKYGKSSFRKDILFIFSTEDEMNQKEIELVNEDFLARDDVYNVSLGGYDTFIRNTTIVKSDTCNDLDVNKYIRIPCEDYDPSVHVTPSKNRITVRLQSGDTMSIPISEFDSDIHQPVFGGIVAKVNGDLRYVTKDEFENSRLRGCHVGKVTVRNKVTGKIHHVTTDEFRLNPSNYEHLSVGYTTGKHKITGETKRFRVEDVESNRSDYNFTTAGYRTVYNLNTRKHENVKIDEFDPVIHVSSVARKFDWFSSDGKLLDSFFGIKRDFIKKHNLPECVWKSFNDGVPVKVSRSKYLHINGSYFVEHEWK